MSGDSDEVLHKPTRRQLLRAAAASLCVGVSATRQSLGAAPASPVRAQKANVALVLGGGGCRGYGHIGVLRALEAAGHRPDLIVGSSVGSIIGALYAAGVSAAELERYGRGLTSNTLRDWIFPKLGIFGGSRISRFVKKHIAVRTIEALPTRFAAVATDLRTGELVVIQRGDIGRAVQASSSLPGLLEPVRMGHRLLVDGNLASPVPVSTAKRLGALRVIAIDVTFPPEEADLGDPFDALYQGFSILTRRLARSERSDADLLLEPALPLHNDMSSATVKALVNAGEHAALEAMPAIAKLFARTK